MGPNAAIDVVIGLVLMYLALSVFCTVVNELLATFFGWRAKSLAAGITQLLDDPTLRNDFYNHGLIDGTKNVSAIGSKANNDGHPSYFSGKVFSMALLGSLDPTKPLAGFTDIESAVKNLPDSNIRDVLLTHIVAANTDLTRLRDGVAIWFDQTMDRLGGVYKRKLKYLSFAIGFVLAVAINADSVQVGKALWHDGALRQQMVKLANLETAPSNPPAVASTASAILDASVGNVRQAEEEIRPLPIGWDFGRKWDLGLESCVLKFIGLILTALALTMGAPFWFDLLSKFINLRGTGEKPARTEAS